MLNLIDTKPAQSTAFSTAVATFWSKSRLSKSESDTDMNPNNKSAQQAKKSPYLRQLTGNFSRTFDDLDLEAATAVQQLRQKNLEVNFNQIAMAYHTDAKVLDSCISIYKERYTRSNNHLSLIFEEVNQILVKFARFLNEDTGSQQLENHSRDR